MINGSPRPRCSPACTSPTKGSLRWDGADISTFDPAALRRSVAVIFQDLVRHQLSARENIALGRLERDAGADGVRTAAAGAHDLLEGLEEG